MPDMECLSRVLDRVGVNASNGGVLVLWITSACSGNLDSTELHGYRSLEGDGNLRTVADEIPGEEHASEWAEPTILCGKAGDLLPDGTRRWFDDVYYPRAIEAELAEEYPDLRDTLGFDQVETCEQAHKWSAARMRMLAEEPSDPSTESLLDTAATERSTVNKIWGGAAYHELGIMLIGKPGIDSYGYCSSVAISPKHLLTAAHCVSANTTICGNAPPDQVACNRSEIFDIFHSTSAGGRQYWGTYSVTTYKFEGYSGIGDPGDDIALLEMDSAFTFPINTNFYNISLRRPYPNDGGPMQTAGWGSTSQYANSQNAGQFLNNGTNDSAFVPDGGTQNGSYFFDSNDDDVNLCKGDSGTPVLKDWDIYGLFSQFEADSGHICRHRNGLKEWFVGVGLKRNWIDQRVRYAPNYTCPSGCNALGCWCCRGAVTVAVCY